MQSITEQFKAFVRSKPEGEYYTFFSTSSDECGCALTQFTIGLGIGAGEAQWEALHDRFDAALRSKPHTFGALADRLSSIDEKVSAE